MTAYDTIIVSSEQAVGLIELNRPQVYNSISRQMVKEVVEALIAFDHDDTIHAVVIHGRGKAFSSGADIDEMANNSTIEMELLNQFADWDRISLIKKPIIGAVHGFVFGGGFELALSCDMLVAAENTEFSFPEISLGVMPGAGGTQRLTKLVGKTKAMEWVITSKRVTAAEAERNGIVNYVVQNEIVLEEAMRLANKIAAQPPIAARLIKESVHKAVDYSLYEGMQFERKNFYLLFSSEDQKEGMASFVEKRKPNFKGR